MQVNRLDTIPKRFFSRRDDQNNRLEKNNNHQGKPWIFFYPGHRLVCPGLNECPGILSLQGFDQVLLFPEVEHHNRHVVIHAKGHRGAIHNLKTAVKRFNIG